MSTIINKGGFEFSCKTPTGRMISCYMDKNEPVEADFNKLELHYSGSVKVYVYRMHKKTMKKEYVSVKRLKPRYENDKADFDIACNEIKIVSQKRKRELKNQKKNSDKRRTA